MNPRLTDSPCKRQQVQGWELSSSFSKHTSSNRERGPVCRVLAEPGTYRSTFFVPNETCSSRSAFSARSELNKQQLRTRQLADTMKIAVVFFLAIVAPTAAFVSYASYRGAITTSRTFSTDALVSLTWKKIDGWTSSIRAVVYVSSHGLGMIVRSKARSIACR